jgi:hypothetical protein
MLIKGVGGQRHTPTALSLGRDPVPIVEEARWAPVPISMGETPLTPTRI